ncbi:hypothetical protein [Amycolatopsis benzoatilytica]|uniref:hypothetical protein n=1 Tax=Amycolatopsis benzoatilytica TaxID=346045 RepID=UPI001FDF47F3|nr:hypothetical protein [Amycolatopsis benzoatilytica]
MFSRRAAATGIAVLTVAASLALAGCGGADNGAASSGAPTANPAITQGPGYWGPGSWEPGMMNGSSAWGPGMMGGRPGSWGPGMMGHRYWLPGTGGAVTTLDQARQRATAFAGQLGLRVGEVMQFSWNFYAELATADGRPATEALVDPATGAVGIEYGPAMMWNTAYGMHSGGETPSTVSVARAGEIAQQWLRDHGSALTVADPTAFPGYYTLHTLDAGKISGMLSVNAATGAVWYHTWHGAYIATSQQ